MQSTIFGLKLSITEKDTLFYIGDSHFNVINHDYRMVLFNHCYSDFGRAAFVSKEISTPSVINSYEEYLDYIGLPFKFLADRAYVNGRHPLYGLIREVDNAAVYFVPDILIRGFETLDIIEGRWFEYGGLYRDTHSLRLIRGFKKLNVLLQHNVISLFQIAENQTKATDLFHWEDVSFNSSNQDATTNASSISPVCIDIKGHYFFSLISRKEGPSFFLFTEHLNALESMSSPLVSHSGAFELSDTADCVFLKGISLSVLLDNVIGISVPFDIIATDIFKVECLLSKTTKFEIE